MSLTCQLRADVPFYISVIGDSISDPGFGVAWDQADRGFRSVLGAKAYAALDDTPRGHVQTATAGARLAGESTVLSGTPASALVRPLPAYPFRFRSYGIPGGGIQEIRNNYAAAVGSGPNHLIVVEVGINDFGASVDVPTHLNNCRGFMDDVRSQFGCQVLWLGALCGVTGGEQWLTGPNRYSSGLSASVYETNIASACAERAAWAEYAEQRAWSLALNVARNVPAPGALVGACTFDQVHPTQATCRVMGEQAATHIDFVWV